MLSDSHTESLGLENKSSMPAHKKYERLTIKQRVKYNLYYACKIVEMLCVFVLKVPIEELFEEGK